ncbi:DUF2510 domain-containing protein [Actinomadura alba]|uniref:DUF2510 domain-containing protein n=1 Tax=Actinomadura alba TaxID=406431 RepID=A0ABR7LVF2_9ACTN|nr:DUF2510 domain-containing protein [Actinomadura alba]MBC6468826.1 DUF2510 domain-containing protein [Actinomadura alba]
MTGQVPPGWYRDPYGTPGLQRYWDGSQWTQATQPTDEWDDSASTPAPSRDQPPDNAEQQHQGFAPQGQQAQQPHQPQPDWASAGPAPGWGAPAPQQQYGWQPAPGQPMPGGPPQRSNTGLIVGLVGGGAALVAVLIVVALIIGSSGDDPEPGPDPLTITTPSVTQAPTAPSAVPGGRSPVIGAITDTQAGLAYSQLGGTWESAVTVSAGNSLGKHGFTRGSIATVQRNYRGAGSSYVASVYSGRLTSTVSSNDLETAAKSLFTAIEPTSYPQPNTRVELESKAYTVSGKRAWYYKVQLSFSQARSEGWNFTKETIVVLTVDRGSGGRPAVFYVSIPDSHANEGDLQLLLSSLRVL